MAPPKKAVRKRLHSFWIEPDQARGLKAVHVRDGILPSEQIRRAIAAWLRRKGIKKGRRTQAQ